MRLFCGLLFCAGLFCKSLFVYIGLFWLMCCTSQYSRVSSVTFVCHFYKFLCWLLFCVGLFHRFLCVYIGLFWLICRTTQRWRVLTPIKKAPFSYIHTHTHTHVHAHTQTDTHHTHTHTYTTPHAHAHAHLHTHTHTVSMTHSLYLSVLTSLVRLSCRSFSQVLATVTDCCSWQVSFCVYRSLLAHVWYVSALSSFIDSFCSFLL